MDPQAANGSAVEVLARCAELGNLSVEVGEYNRSCANISVLPRPSYRPKGKILFFCTSSCVLVDHPS